MAMSNRIHLYGKCLISSGIEVEIIVPSKKKDPKKRVHEEVLFSTVKDPVIFSNYFLRQINGFFAAFIFAIYCFTFSKTNKIIFICGFGWFSTMLAIIGAHLGGAKIVLEVNENPYSPEGGRFDTLYIRKLRRLMTLILPFRYADGFIVISQKLRDLVAKYKRKQALIIKIPILVDNSQNVTVVTDKPKIPYILHAGALSETKDGMIAVFKAFAKANKNLDGNLKFILTQKKMQHSLFDKIDNIIETNNLRDNISFTGYLSMSELDQIRRYCSVAIINKPSNWQNDYNFPTKLGEYLVNGVPTIVSSTGEMSLYLKDMENAFIVPANDSDAIAEKLIYIVNHPEVAANIGNAGKQLALKEFHYINFSQQIKNFFIKVIN